MKTILYCICCSCFILLTGCQQKKTPDTNTNAETQQAAIKIMFAEFDAKAAALPYTPVEVTEDGLLILADANFMEVVNEGGILVVDFWIDGCWPCEDMVPIIRGLARQYKDKVRFGKLHANNNLIMTEKYQVQGFPTFAFFVDGQLIMILTGGQESDRMRMILDKILLAHQAKQDTMVPEKGR